MDVGLALRNTSKGKIKYDKYWARDGRTKEVLDEISKLTSKITISISPKAFSNVVSDVKAEIKSPEKEVKPAMVEITSAEKIKNSSDKMESHFYEAQSEMELPILEYEHERLKYIQEFFNAKKVEFDNFSLELQQQVMQEYLLLKRKNELDAKRRDGALKKIEEAILDEARKTEIILKEQYQNHAKKLSARVQEADLKQKKLLEEMRKREQEQAEFKLQLSNCISESQSLAAKAEEKLLSCEHPNHLRLPAAHRKIQMEKILQSILNFVEVSKTKDLTIDDILNANYAVKEAYETVQDIVNDIETAKTKALQQEKAATFSFRDNSSHANNFGTAQLPNVPDKIDGVSQQFQSPESNEMKNSEQIKTKESNQSEEEQKKILAEYLAPDATEDYYKIMKNMNEVESRLQPLKSDPRNKKLRFELQKLINVPINSLSSNSGSQIKSKINRLLSMLSGKMPEVQGQNMGPESAAYSFCSYLIARQFVEQSDSVVSSQPATAFPIAMAIISIWSKKPDVGSLILGHFYTRCPFLVPYYPPKQKGQSDKDYFKVLGYHIDDEDNIEPVHKFLKRVSGYVRLYAAILVSPLPPNAGTPHPHGIEWGWKLLSRLLNLQPREDITATVLYNLLDVAGHALQKTYGKQFKKMLHILCKDYFQKIKQDTPGGPVGRLETFLQGAIKKGQIPPPDGILEPQFWNR